MQDCNFVKGLTPSKTSPMNVSGYLRGRLLTLLQIKHENIPDPAVAEVRVYITNQHTHVVKLMFLNKKKEVF